MNVLSSEQNDRNFNDENLIIKYTVTGLLVDKKVQIAEENEKYHPSSCMV